jgi:hypothetical protein
VEEWWCPLCEKIIQDTAYVGRFGRYCESCFRKEVVHAAHRLTLVKPTVEEKQRTLDELRLLTAATPLPCEVCGRKFAWIVDRRPWPGHVCSTTCARERRNRARRVRHEERKCAVCCRGFEPKRSEALYCSARCRQRAYRARREGAAQV